MTDSDLMRIARELVMTDYFDRKEYLYLKWRADADLLWKTERKTLPYPDTPSYPSDDEVIKKFKLLKSFLTSTQQPEQEIVQTEETTPLAENQVTESQEKTEETVTEQKVVEEKKETQQEVVEEKTKEPVKEKPQETEEKPKESTVENKLDLDQVLALSRIRALERDMAETTMATRMLPEINKTLEQLRTTLFQNNKR